MVRRRKVGAAMTRVRAMVLAAAALLVALPLSMPAAANGGGGGGGRGGGGGGPGPAAGGGGGGPGGGMLGRPLGDDGGPGARGGPGSMERGKPVGLPGTGGGISGPLGSPGGGSTPGRSFPGGERGSGGSGFGTGGSLFRGAEARDSTSQPMGARPSLPADATMHRFRGQQYFQSQGSWFVTRAGQLVTVPAPVGLVVESLPPAHETRWIDGVPYFVSGGAFFVWRERERKYEIVEPPAGGVRTEGTARDGSAAAP